jgi:hypothetical protein
MMRNLQIFLMVMVAMLLVAVPTAVAQTPPDDQYKPSQGPVGVPGTPVEDGDDGAIAPADDGGTAPADDGGTAPADDGGTAPADDAGTAPATSGLPFTGGEISLIALIGLGLLAVGMAALAISRRLRGPTA